MKTVLRSRTLDREECEKSQSIFIQEKQNLNFSQTGFQSSERENVNNSKSFQEQILDRKCKIQVFSDTNPRQRNRKKKQSRSRQGLKTENLKDSNYFQHSKYV